MRRCLQALCCGLISLGQPALAQHLRPTDLAGLPVTAPTKVEAYGADPLQHGELRVPKGPGPFPIAVIIHGGCWTKGFATLSYMSPLASDLADKGVATWNIEYRQLGDPGGGWPGSFQDWAAATDHLRALAKTYPIDLSRVIVLGHSAGAHAALWVASRGRIPAGGVVRGADPLKIKAAIAIDGPGDLEPLIGRDAEICGQPVIAPFMGGLPTQASDHYSQGDPIKLLPSGVASVMVASSVLTADEAETYRKAATAKGDQIEILSLNGAAHFDMLAPAKSQGRLVEALILQSLDIPGP